MKVFVDTNILIDLVCKREKFLTDAQKVFALGYAHCIELSLSALSFVNAMYLAHHYNLSTVEMADSLTKISQFAEIADLSGEVAKWALACGWKDYEDATQYGTALSAVADCIVTRNKNDFKESKIPVYSASELFSLLGL